MVSINSGFIIHTYSWGTVTPANRKGVVVHHAVTAEGGSAAGAQSILRGINKQHPYGSYNYVVDYLGNIYEIVGLIGVGAHAYNANTAYWGICYIGDGRYNFTAAAERSIRGLVEYLQGRAGKKLPVYGHQQINSTACPGGIIQARVNAGAFGAGYSGPATGGGSGNSSEAIKEIQRLLNQFDYGLDVDGQVGPKTDAAIRDFQRAWGLVDDGQVGPLTMEKLTPNRTGQSIKWVQERLAAHGFNPGPIDDRWGHKTDAALRDFQKANGLVADGIAGPATTPKLSAAPTPSAPPAPRVRFEKFDSAKQFFIGSAGANLVDINTFKAVETYKADTLIWVAGRAIIDGEAYLMTSYSFGHADTTGTPFKPWAFKASDLSEVTQEPDEEPGEVPVDPEVPEEPETPVEPPVEPEEPEVPEEPVEEPEPPTDPVEVPETPGTSKAEWAAAVTALLAALGFILMALGQALFK